MKPKNFVPFILAVIFYVNINAQASVMTYNLRYNNPDDKENCWENRKGDVVDMFNYYKPDIFGIQEGLKAQVTFLDENLYDYDYVGVGRDDGKEKGEYAAVFYNMKKYRVLEFKTYWLSDTPNKPSIGWDAVLERIVSYVVIENISTEEIIYVFNAHYDHMGKAARENSSKLILSLIEEKELLDKQVIVMGDLNSEPESTPIKIFTSKLEDPYQSSAIKHYGPEGTFNGFNTTEIVTTRIDYIFVKNLTVNSYRIIDDRRPNNLYLSDHLPVFINIE